MHFICNYATIAMCVCSLSVQNDVISCIVQGYGGMHALRTILIYKRISLSRFRKLVAEDKRLERPLPAQYSRRRLIWAASSFIWLDPSRIWVHLTSKIRTPNLEHFTEAKGDIQQKTP